MRLRHTLVPCTTNLENPSRQISSANSTDGEPDAQSALSNRHVDSRIRSDKDFVAL